MGKLAHAVSTLNTVLRNARWLNPAMEIVYRDVFLRDLKRLGIEDVFYPVGNAANHGLLYAITRSFAEFPDRLRARARLRAIDPPARGPAPDAQQVGRGA